MVTRRLTGAWAGLLVAAVALGACTSDPGPTDAEIAASEAAEARFAGCAALAADVTETLQGFVDQFAPAADEVGEGPEAEVPRVGDLQEAIETFGRRRAALGCEPREFQVLLARAVDELRGQGSLARAVAAQVRDELLPTPGPPESVSVAPGEDLAAAVHDAGPDALIELQPGRHELDEPLVLLRPTRLVGAGSGRTTIVSEAAGTVLLQAGEGSMVLEGLTVAHEGSEPASVVVVANGGYDLRDVEVRGGVVDDAGGSGWGLVVGVRGHEDVTGLQRVTDLRVTDNEAGGMAIAADRAPLVAGVEADDNGRCGICFSGSATGDFSRVRAHGNGVGILFVGDTAPELVDVETSGNTEAGIVAEELAAATARDVRVTGNGAVGVVLRGTSNLQLEAVTVGDHEELGVLIEGSATPRVLDTEVTGSPIGTLVRGEAAPELGDVVIGDVTDAHIVWTATASGRITAATCGAAAPGLVLLERADPQIGDGVCEVVDQREG